MGDLLIAAGCTLEDKVQQKYFQWRERYKVIMDSSLHFWLLLVWKLIFTETCLEVQKDCQHIVNPCNNIDLLGLNNLMKIWTIN